MSETPLSRVEQLLAALQSGGELPEGFKPLSRVEVYLAALLSGEVPDTEPLSRVETYLAALCQKGMGGGTGTTINNQDKTITANGEYTADTGYTGLGTVRVSVPAKEPVIEALTVTENGVYEVPEGLDGYAPVTVNVAGTGSATPSAKHNDVTFIDYDGAVLYSYSLSEAQALTELPALPSHDGLVCQGWNWTLDAIKALNRPVTVGAAYITDDGATRLHIRIATIGRMTVPLCFWQAVEDGVSIDWGDGSESETLAGTGYVNTSHTYAQPGDYVISLLPEDGCTLSLGAGSSDRCVLGATDNSGKVYANMLQAAHIGRNVTSIGNSAFYNCYSLASVTIPAGVTSIGNSAFQNCYSLASVTIPAGVTSIGNSAFQNCYSLASVTIPDGVTSIGFSAFYNCYSLASVTIPAGVTSIGNSAFNSCYSLASVTIPDGVTSIGDYAFAYCYSLASVTIPDGVTSIGSSAFQNCYGVGCYDFTACTSVPALSSTNAFTGIPSDCEMLIPAALYDEWIAATNWATYADYMVAV